MPTKGTYSGKIAHVRVVLGKGAYVKPGDKDFGKDGDPFAFDFGKDDLKDKSEDSEESESDLSKSELTDTETETEPDDIDDMKPSSHK